MVSTNERTDLDLEGLKVHEVVGMSALSSMAGVSEVLGSSLVWLPRGAAARTMTPLTSKLKARVRYWKSGSNVLQRLIPVLTPSECNEALISSRYSFLKVIFVGVGQSYGGV